MTRRTFAVSTLLLWSAACEPPDAGATRDFVLFDYGLDEDDLSSPAAGFDLDGRASTVKDPAGCSFEDRVSELDPDQNGPCGPNECRGAVDNMLPTLADNVERWTLQSLQQALTAREQQGRLVWLLRVSGLRGPRDREVRVSIFHGFTADRDCGELFRGDGRFLVDDTSLETPGDLGSARWQADGAIVDDRLRVRLGQSEGVVAEAPVGIGDSSEGRQAGPLSVYQLRLRATLDRPRRSGERGNLGGWARAAELRDVLADAGPGMRTALDGLIPRIADLPDPQGECGGSFGEPAGGMSLGLRFRLAPARIVGTAPEPPEGACAGP